MRKRVLSHVLGLIAALTLPVTASATDTRRVIRKVFGANATARCIAKHESGFRADAVSPTHDYGLFQINSFWFGKVVRWHGRFKYIQRRWIFDPEYNARVAWIISRGGHVWSPWTTYQPYCA